MIFFRVALPFIAGFFVSYMYRAVNAVLGPTLAAEFGLTAGGLGLLTSVYFLAFALFQLPLGLLLDRFGPRRVNATLLLVAAAGGTWFAGAHTATEAIAARALIGLGVSGCLMSSVLAFVLWYPPARYATMNGIAFSAGALGSMTVSVPLEMLLRVWPWRSAFMLLVGATLAVSLTLWFWVPEKSARPSGASLADQLRGLGRLVADAGFRRIALAMAASQIAAMALQ
ncbi:MAG: MFS transporter, partial [Burkholderiales bacterium]